MLKYSTTNNLLGLDKSNISKTIKKLVEKNLIIAEKDKIFTKYYLTS